MPKKPPAFFAYFFAFCAIWALGGSAKKGAVSVEKTCQLRKQTGPWAVGQWDGVE